MDLKLGKRILDSMWFDFEAANALDRPLTEVSGVPLPGRWLTVTATWHPGVRR